MLKNLSFSIGMGKLTQLQSETRAVLEEIRYFTYARDVQPLVSMNRLTNVYVSGVFHHQSSTFLQWAIWE